MDSLALELIDNLNNNQMTEFFKNYAMYAKKHTKINFMSITIFDPIVFSNYNEINGLYYIENYLTSEELQLIKDFINSEANLQPLTPSSLQSRRVAHYGYYYAYDRSGLTAAPKIPDSLLKIVEPDRLNRMIGPLVNKPFEQLIINEYRYRNGISKHIDHPEQFGPIIACITIGQCAPIIFRNSQSQSKIKISPAEGSIYIMTGDSRYQWTHELTNTGTETRYSLTYRTIKKN